MQYRSRQRAWVSSAGGTRGEAGRLLNSGPATCRTSVSAAPQNSARSAVRSAVGSALQHLADDKAVACTTERADGFQPPAGRAAVAQEKPQAGECQPAPKRAGGPANVYVHAASMH